MSETAKIELDGKVYELPVVVGTENEKAIDISKLRDLTGYITLDTGYKNTGATKSSITYLDGEEGILHYRGYSIEQLAEKATFIEVSYLLIYGNLPNRSELNAFQDSIRKHTLVHEDMKQFFEAYPSKAHPMGVLSSTIASLATFYPESLDPNRSLEAKNLTIHRLIAKLPTLAAWSYKNLIRHPFMYPRNEYDYCKNLMYMMFSMPTEDYHVDPVVTDALNKLLILHADGGNVDKWVAKAKDKEDPFRLMGFGHRVYKNFDPRAKIIKKACDDVLEKLGVNDPLLEIAKKLEKVALEDEYFKARNLYPNVDFYSGIIYKAMGIPTEMFTVMFAIGRLPGWIAQWKEMTENKEPIGRPRQIYTGHTNRNYVPVDER
ncbi:MAG: hypothetical protein RL349_193 [Bacteroidota bacterium]